MPNKFDKFADEAVQKTDDAFRTQFAKLTTLQESDVETLINDTGISKEDLAKVLQQVQDASASNEAKAAAIKKINNGVSALVAIAKKFL